MRASSASPVGGELHSASAEGVLELLAAASLLLERPEDYPTALGPLVRLLVPQWAGGCTIGLLDTDGSMCVAATAGVRPDATVLARRVPHAPIKSVGESGWTIELAIAARGHGFGFLWMAGSGEPALSLSLAEELARRLGMAIDSANAIAREQHIAETLQRALLPERLPPAAEAVLDAAYRPASGESTVGGDWYDAFELPDGRIGVSVGDVAGHGLSAAVVMCDARQAVRASAFNAITPSDVLARANSMLQTAPMMVTALFGVFDPKTSTFAYATAGHPPPVVHTPSGTTFLFPAGDMPLGVDDGLRPPTWTFTLQPDTLLVLYTDGIIEYQRDLLAGERKLFEAVAAEYGRPSANPARSIQERIFRRARNNDDVATLTLRIAPRPVETFECIFSAVPFAAPYVRSSLKHFLEQREIDSDRQFSIITSVGEAVANSVEHAYTGEPGTVALRVEVDGLAVRVQIEDAGRWRPAQREDERGRGIPMMRALMDRVEIRTDHSRTQIRMSLNAKDLKAG